ncbi:kinase-like domain-containing protein [Glomus cerebriforme]|uniref:Kinase-like domain-containing protein n=1 Tax=Glomus cerebriforme TaxID=658196 RepID=A0A397T653_9GLOM|nr:kinase-like domain-containing protein [Glomus cerebriforme]
MIGMFSRKSEDSDVELDVPMLKLDFNMLRQLASNRLDRNCIRTRRLTRGANNEIHLLQFDNGPDCIARFPCDPTHPTEKLTCEVATMKYIAQNTKIKVPEVYDWDCSTNNIIKSPYILMEHLSGQHLYLIWNELTVENKKSVLNQIINILFEIWSKCQFDEIGCLYMNDIQDQSSYLRSRDSTPFMSFEIGPIVSPLFYIEERDTIPSFTGPFNSSKKWFDALIQKEKKFFEAHGLQKFIAEMNVDLADAEERTTKLVKQLSLLQSKISKDNPFESIDLFPFTIIHDDFDAQNILVERSLDDNDIKIVGIIDWEFSHIGTFWDLCNYPIWIQEIELAPFDVISDKESQRNWENQELRTHFRNKMVATFGEKGRQMLDMKEKDKRIEGYRYVKNVVLMVNHLSPFLLTIKLLDTLKKSATPNSPSKISFTSSVTNHYYNLNVNDLYLEQTKHISHNYYYTKIMNIMISNEIARNYRHMNITSSSSHPGLINTQIMKSDNIIGYLLVQFVKYHTESWEQGAINMLYPVLCPDINDNGKYFDKSAEREPNKSALDEETCKILWDASVDLLKEKGFLE